MKRQTPPAGWYPFRGEVYWVAIDKMRPAVVLSVDSLNRHARDVCVVPITSVEHKAFFLRVFLTEAATNLRGESWAKCDQVTTVPRTAVRYPAVGRLGDSQMLAIEAAVRNALGLRVGAADEP